MAIKGTLRKSAPVEVIFQADLQNKSHVYVDHYPTPTTGSDVVFSDVGPGETSSGPFGATKDDSRRYFVEYHVATGDHGTLTVKQDGVVKATGPVPDGDTFWLFGVF